MSRTAVVKRKQTQRHFHYAALLACALSHVKGEIQRGLVWVWRSSSHRVYIEVVLPLQPTWRGTKWLAKEGDSNGSLLQVKNMNGLESFPPYTLTHTCSGQRNHILSSNFIPFFLGMSMFNWKFSWPFFTFLNWLVSQKKGFYSAISLGYLWWHQIGVVL